MQRILIECDNIGRKQVYEVGMRANFAEWLEPFLKVRGDEMKQEQRGFTLIELVMVIVILGVLAAVALPRFVDLKGDAVKASTDGVAGALSSAAAINYASRSISTSKGVQVTDCQNVANAMQGGLPTGYTITSAAVGNGASVTCTLTNAGPPSTTSTFTAIGITP